MRLDRVSNPYVQHSKRVFYHRVMDAVYSGQRSLEKSQQHCYVFAIDFHIRTGQGQIVAVCAKSGSSMYHSGTIPRASGDLANKLESY